MDIAARTGMRQLHRRWQALALACSFALPGTAWAEVTVKPAARGYDIDITEEATSSDLIDAIAEATGANVKGEPEDASLAPNHLRSTSLERAIRMLIPGAKFAVRFNDDDSPAEIIFLASGVDGDGAGLTDSDVPSPPPGTDANGVIDYGSGADETSQ